MPIYAHWSNNYGNSPTTTTRHPSRIVCIVNMQLPCATATEETAASYCLLMDTTYSRRVMTRGPSVQQLDSTTYPCLAIFFWTFMPRPPFAAPPPPHTRYRCEGSGVRTYVCTPCASRVPSGKRTSQVDGYVYYRIPLCTTCSSSSSSSSNNKDSIVYTESKRSREKEGRRVKSSQAFFFSFAILTFPR